MWKVYGRTTTTDRRTDDGRCAMTIAHSSLRLRWANNIGYPVLKKNYCCSREWLCFYWKGGLRDSAKMGCDNSDAKPKRRHCAPYLTHTKTVFLLAKIYDSATNKTVLFYINRYIIVSFHHSHYFLLIWFSLSREFTLEVEWGFTIRTAWFFRFEKYRLLKISVTWKLNILYHH